MIKGYFNIITCPPKPPKIEDSAEELASMKRRVLDSGGVQLPFPNDIRELTSKTRIHKIHIIHIDEKPRFGFEEIGRITKSKEK